MSTTLFHGRGACVTRTCAALAALASIASAQELRWSIYGESHAARFGRTVAWVGDWDGDGSEDFAAAAPFLESAVAPRVLVVSSATRKLLLEVQTGEPMSFFGYGLAAIGDVDGDGRSELATFAPSSVDPVTGAFGALFVHDSSGALRWTHRPPSATGYLSGMVAIGDVDGDSVRDLLTYEFDTSTPTTTHVDLLSGATGSAIRQHFGPSAQYFGFVSGALDDVDGDAIPDYLVTSQDPSLGIGKLHAFSGATGTSLYVAASGGPVECATRIADIDGDGIDDLGVGTSFSFDSSAGYLASGVDGSKLVSLFPLEAFVDMAAAGDLDGDGLGDVVATMQGSTLASEVRAYSSATGLELAALTIGETACFDLDGGVDFDGDGAVDLLCGIPDDPFNTSGIAVATGIVKVVSLASWSELAAFAGVDFNVRGFGTTLAILPDRDGDGGSEVASAVEALAEGAGSVVQVRSSIDGSELARIPVAGGIGARGLPMIGVADVDGDQVDDWLLAALDRTVEVRSGHDDSLLQTWSLPSGEPIDVAAATDAAGHAVAAFVTRDFASNTSEIAVHDLATGTISLVITRPRWNSVACMGDVDQDGVLDWVGCDVAPVNGLVVAFSGANGATFWTAAGPKFLPANYARTTADLSGDGEDDVLVGCIGSGFGRVVAYSGAGGAKLFEITDAGLGAGSGFATSIRAIGDVDRDGFGDFAVTAPFGGGSVRGLVDLHSGKTARRLQRILGAFESHSGEKLADLPRGGTFVLDGGRRTGLAISSPRFGTVAYGKVELRALSDLFLEIDPPQVVEGQFVSAATRGGAAGARVGLYLVAIDGVRIDQFCEFSFLDTFGEWTTSDVMPTGLAGTEFTLRSYAVGNDGRLSVSSDETLTIE